MSLFFTWDGFIPPVVFEANAYTKDRGCFQTLIWDTDIPMKKS